LLKYFRAGRSLQDLAFLQDWKGREKRKYPTSEKKKSLYISVTKRSTESCRDSCLLSAGLTSSERSQQLHLTADFSSSFPRDKESALAFLGRKKKIKKKKKSFLLPQRQHLQRNFYPFFQTMLMV